MIRRQILVGTQRVLLVFLAIIVLVLFYLGGRVIWSLNRASLADVKPTPLVALKTPLPGSMPTAIPLMTVLPNTTPGAPAQAQGPLKIGIVAGHWQNDPGAVCDDGLQEVEINLDIARRVVSELSLAGYNAEMLAEFSPKLDGYEAALLLSIHADSCNVPGATGFKVARVSSSLVPEIEDLLVSCLITQYGKATGLNFHKSSITFDMTEYHAFYEIAPQTPGAIIEIGFMGEDRYVMTHRQDLVVAGIVNGIKSFMGQAYY